LADELATTPDGFQGQWANQTIAGFLEASAAWAKDSRLTHEKASHDERRPLDWLARWLLGIEQSQLAA
jgi:hypothetical protein